MVKIRKNLIKHPYIAVAILLFFFIGILLFPDRFASSYNARFGYDFFYIIFFYVILPFTVLFIFWNLIIPYSFLFENNENWNAQLIKDYNKEIGLSSTEYLGRSLSLCLIFILIYYFFSVLGDYLLGTPSWSFSALFSNFEINNRGWFNFIINLRAPFWEEIAFRGVIMVIFLKAFSTRKAIILNGLIFGSFHFINFLISRSDIWISLLNVLAQMGYATVLGLFLAYLFTKTNSLIPCIVIHYFNNIISYILSTSFENAGLFLISFILFNILIPWGINFLILKYTHEYWEQENQKTFISFNKNKLQGYEST